MGGLIGTATTTKNGLMPSDGFLRLGVKTSLDNIGTGFGYSTSADGTGYSGIFFSLEEYGAKMQLKLDHYNGKLFFRAYDEVSQSWGGWKTVATV